MRAEFSESSIEEWVLDLLPANLVPKRLAKQDLPRVRAYLKQPSYRPKRSRSTTDEIRNRLQQNKRV
jgi:hypothetical protein